MTGRSGRTTAATIAACAVVAAIYLLRLNTAAGLLGDDGWYILLARSLASGEGFTLSHTPEGGLPKYPPGFPLLLSLVFLIAPGFPANVYLLKGISVIAMAGVGIASFRYFAQRSLPAPMAAGLAIAVVSTPAFVFLATSTVMSEGVFTLSLLVTLLLVERSLRVGTTSSMLLAAGLGAATVLIRTAGAPLLLAIPVYLCAKGRWRPAALFLVTAAACLAPWVAYTAARPPSPQGSYTTEVWRRWADDPSSGRVTIGDFPARIANNAFDVFGRAVAGIVVPELFRGPTESGEETVSLGGAWSATASGSMGSATGTMAVSILLSALAVIGFVSAVRRGATATEFFVPLSLALTLVWPFWTFRFVLPLAPYLLFYLLAGVRALTAHWMRVARIGLLSILGLHLLDHTLYLARSEDAVWLNDAREVEGMMTWMQQNLAGPGAVASSHPALVYLHTGRTSVPSGDYRSHWEDWTARGVRYVAMLRTAPLPGPPFEYTVRYQTTRRKLWVIEVGSALD